MTSPFPFLVSGLGVAVQLGLLLGSFCPKLLSVDSYHVQLVLDWNVSVENRLSTPSTNPAPGP